MNVETSRLPIVGVMGSGREPSADRAQQLGIWLAEIGVNLLTGGGSGVMNEVSKAFASCAIREGRVIGVVPGSVESNFSHEVPDGYPNRWVELAIFTHLPYSGSQGTSDQSRNHINILSSDVIVFLPGSAGTSSEASLALRYGKPCIAWLDNRDQIAGLPAEIRVEGQFETIKSYVLGHIALHHG